MSVLSTHGPVVTATNLRCSFGGVHALAGVDLAVHPGQVHTLLGTNGAGKSTLVRILATLERPTSGAASVCGFDVVTQRQQVRERIALVGQGTSIDEALTGRENLRMVAGLHGLRRAAAHKRADELLCEVGLDQAADRPAKTYSGGMRRRLDLAASLVSEPRVLFVDEPTTGLDPRAKTTIWNLIRGRAQAGCAVLLTTQDLTEAQALSTRITVLNAGKVLTSGTPAQLRADIGTLTMRLTTSHGDITASAPDVPAGVHLAQHHLDQLDASNTATALTIDTPSLTDAYLTLTGAHQ